MYCICFMFPIGCRLSFRLSCHFISLLYPCRICRTKKMKDAKFSTSRPKNWLHCDCRKVSEQNGVAVLESCFMQFVLVPNILFQYICLKGHPWTVVFLFCFQTLNSHKSNHYLNHHQSSFIINHRHHNSPLVLINHYHSSSITIIITRSIASSFPQFQISWSKSALPSKSNWKRQRNGTTARSKQLSTALRIPPSQTIRFRR